MGPAIIPFTVLDSGMVRSYRGKGRWSKRCGASGAGVFPPNVGSTSSLFCSLESHSTPNQPCRLHGLPRHGSDDCPSGETGQVLVNTEGAFLLLCSGSNKCVPVPKFHKDGGNGKAQLWSVVWSAGHRENSLWQIMNIKTTVLASEGIHHISKKTKKATWSSEEICPTFYSC